MPFPLFFFKSSGESRSVQVQLSADKMSYVAQQLLEDIEYMFSVKARTSVGWGSTSVSNITIGPQPGTLEGS